MNRCCWDWRSSTVPVNVVWCSVWSAVYVAAVAHIRCLVTNWWLWRDWIMLGVWWVGELLLRSCWSLLRADKYVPVLMSLAWYGLYFLSYLCNNDLRYNEAVGAEECCSVSFHSWLSNGVEWFCVPLHEPQWWSLSPCHRVLHTAGSNLWVPEPAEHDLLRSMTFCFTTPTDSLSNVACSSCYKQCPINFSLMSAYLSRDHSFSSI